MSKQTQGLAAVMPSTEELKTAGIRELSAEELLEVNGGRQVEGAINPYGPDPDIPDDPPSSSGSSSDYSSGSSSGSSGSSETSSGSSIDSSSNTSEDTSSSSSSDTSDDNSSDSTSSSGSSSNASEDTSSSSTSDTSNDSSSDSNSSSGSSSNASEDTSSSSSSDTSNDSSSDSYEDEESGSYSYSNSNEISNNSSSNSSSSSSSYSDKDDSSSYAKNHSGSSSGNSLAGGNNGKKQTSSNSDAIAPANKPNNEQTKPSYRPLNAGSQVVGGNITYNANNKTFSDTQRGSIKDKTKIVVQRTRNHTKGHYLSTLNVTVQSSDNTTVTLFSNPVQSWADKDKKLGDNDFTMLAGNYKGTLLKTSASGLYKEPIALTNENLGVFQRYGFLIHANEQTSGKKWKNTGGSEGCQILQGQMNTYNIFTQTLKNAGFVFNNKDVIDVQIKDPVGYYTTQDGQEISLNKKGTIPW